MDLRTKSLGYKSLPIIVFSEDLKVYLTPKSIPADLALAF